VEPRYVPVAEIARPHGVQGELRLRLFNERSDLLHGRPPLRLRLPDGAEREARIEGARPTNGALLIRLAGVTDRDAAEALRGATVCVPRDAFPPAEEGEFYACDVEGAQVVTASGEVIGRVRGISSYPSCDALVVELVAARPTVIEIPLTESYVASVDVERRTVAIVTLEGLL
jgi:16S rRNA processing protein RimM